LNKPLSYESQVLRRNDLGLMLWLWRRQGRKTTNMAKLALKKMMKKPGRLVTFASVSIMVGRELLVKEAMVLNAAFESWKKDVAESGMKLEMNTDGLSADDFCDLFERGRVEAKIWHSKTVCSRTVIIAPNVATARGWSGDVFIDEIGFIVDFKDLWEAMEPIMSSDPDFSAVMATTPPNDDGHYSYELAVPPEGTVFTPDENGHWYVSQAGVNVHRVDVYDADAAGLKLYDINSREALSPAEHRLKSLDRDAWDRNYALIFKTGGTSALSLQAIHVAMNQGRGKCLFGEDAFPPGWRDLLTDDPTSVGYDIATTENKTSNPGSITISQKLGNRIVERVGVVFKTADPDFARAMLRESIDLGRGRRPRRLVIDASNERFFATDLKRELAGIVIVELVVAGESIEYRGEKMNYKTYTGSLYVDLYEDGYIAIAEHRYLREDRRLVVKEKGLFVNQTDSRGRHGDTFDSGKLAAHGLITRGGPAEAEAVPIGQYSKPASAGKWKNPFLKFIEPGVTQNV
jgi:hypothetical protein